MQARSPSQSHQEISIAVLARESELPVDEVTRLFEVEQAKLTATAHMTKYLPIFALRNVRDALRRRPGAKRRPTL